MVIPARALIGAALCVLLSACITTHRIQIIASRTSASDLATTRRISARVAAQHGLTLVEPPPRVPADYVERRSGLFGGTVEVPRSARPSGWLDEYAKQTSGIFGGHGYTEPDMTVVDSPYTRNTTVITIGHWLDTPERSKIADDMLAVLQREFGKDRVQRHDDRWTEW
jgi:hypothetical protein